MRLLADENFPGDVVSALRQAGHDIAWIRADAPGSRDEDVLQRAQKEARILLTFDKDFGELAFKYRLPASSGVVLSRITASSSAYIAHVAVTVLASRDDWQAHFTVIEDHRIRMTPLPAI